jgi:hypothetical protein
MDCRICRRGACTESFHSIAEQEQFERDNEKEIEEERRSFAIEARWQEKQGEDYGSY